MCFSKELSATFSVVGTLVTLWVLRTSGNVTLAKGVFYFVLMEILQFFQYSYIAEDVDPINPSREQLLASPQCQDAANQFLTFLGFLHICFQPVFTHYISCAFVKRDTNVVQFKLVRRLCLAGGSILLARHVLAMYPHALEGVGVSADQLAPSRGNLEDEWLSGDVLCTYKGAVHLAWSVPMIQPSYYVPSMGIHSFLMFIPFFVMDHGSFSANVSNWISGLLLFISGPVVGDMLGGGPQESASIWCFFSICQISFLVVLLFMSAHSRGRWYVSQTGLVKSSGEGKKKNKKKQG